MQRPQLEHIVRAATGITGAKEFVIIGSQAILGSFPEAAAELLVSIEADIFNLDNPADSELIDGAIGEGSQFHQTFGYYAHGVAEETAVLPAGWRERLVPVQNENTGGATGLCLEAHDLAISKLVAGREKDLEFVEVLIANEMVGLELLSERLAATELDCQIREFCVSRLKRLSGFGL